ncbi:MAG: NPCBM/NEW2 domain-containing protein [Planctomycetaceae bacterium]
MVFILAVLLTAAVEVRLTTVDGVTRDASLLGVSEAGIQIDANGTAQSISMDDVLSISRSDAPASTSPPMRVELFAGSRIAASEVTTADANVVIQPRDQPALTVPLKQVRWVRFRPSSPAVDPQWLGMIDKPRTADVLVVRRAGNALDEAQGIVKSIAPDAVTIDMDGDDLAAPIDKLEGILFADSAAETEPRKIIVEDTLGSRWQVLSLKSASGDNMRLDLGDGIEHEIPLSQLKKIETTGSVLFLASEPAAQSSYDPVSKLGLDATLAARWFTAKPVDGRDLVMRADSTAEYRLDGQFSTVLGSVQVDPSVVAGGKCGIRILLDDTVAWDQVFDVEDPAPRGYELPIGNARRIRFEVSSAGDGDIGDTLRLHQPRLVK